jgi:signal transduction histidine kinase
MTRILIVEDDLISATLLKRILESKGYEVLDLITSGEEALIKIAADRPDMVLMDIQLHGDTDGIDTAMQIHGNFFIPVIYITAVPDSETIQRATTTASYGYIIKPYNANSIYAAIEMALKKHSLEREVRNRNEELQNLAAHMELLQEEERKKIARELHDYLGQSLTALRIDCSRLLNHLEESGNGKESMKNTIISMVGLIDETLENVRDISAALRPGILDHLGLAAAIKWQGNELQKRTNIKFNHHFASDDVNADDEISTALFRIFQEAATNVMRHTSATEVDVLLSIKENDVILTVKDNGRGIAENEINNPRSFGLIGMRERARYYGGSINISRREETGTEVVAILPMKFHRGKTENL